MNSRVERLRSDIRSVWPCDCPEVSVNPNLLEEFDVSKRLEYRASERIKKVNLTFGAVFKLYPDDVISNVAHGNDVEQFHFLLQRLNPVWRLAFIHELPVSCEFLLMKTPPFENQPDRAGRQTASQPTIGDIHGDLTPAVARVEMGRRMLIVIHRYHDSEEPAYLRHKRII